MASSRFDSPWKSLRIGGYFKGEEILAGAAVTLLKPQTSGAKAGRPFWQT
jgi:hypothetical protein